MNNKRIAKNTLLLYVRMFFIMAVTLYTSRVILQILGIEDYGIFNVVSGIVAMVGILNSAMSSSMLRYYSFELGKGDPLQLRKTFSISMYIYILLCIIFFILAETIGLWFLNNKLVIPENRIGAANWIYQFSIISVINQLVSNPYNAAIISHERMKIYAYVSALEAILRLAIVFLLPFINFDQLATYGFLYMLLSIIVTTIYRIYCKKNFQECTLRRFKDKRLFIELLSYCGWNIFGASSALVKGQGLNILLNMFFNPAVNAARGIAYQINAAIQQFSSNFYTAVRPQITKYYAQGDIDNMYSLVFRSSKFSFYLILLLSLPIIIEMPFFINLWLGQIPEYVIPFSRLIIGITAVDAMAHPLMTTAHATGRIALYQSSVGITTIMNIPISYIVLKYFNAPPIIVYEISLFIAISCLFIRLWIVRRLLGFPVLKYIKEVLLVSLYIGLLSSIIPVFVHCNINKTVLNSIFVCLLSVFMVLFAVYFWGLKNDEKSFVKNIVTKKFKSR